MLKILDNLHNKEKHNLKLLSESFVTHSLLRNDISRIMNPIFVLLLMPSTARISIRHINVHNADLQNKMNSQDMQKLEDAKAKKIYAISNINGNIMYHVTEDENLKPSKRKSFLFSKAGKKMTGIVSTTASILENSSVVTKRTKDFKSMEAPPSLDGTSTTTTKSNVKLFINPLSSKEVYPNGVTGSYTKLESNDDSSTESLSSLTQTSNGSSLGKNFHCSDTYLSLYPTDRDSGFESQNDSLFTKFASEGRQGQSDDKDKDKHKSLLLEHIEPISNGVADRRLPKSHSFDEKNSPGKVSKPKI